MARILLLGSDVSLLEGLAQTLAAVGHVPILADGLGEAVELAASEPPLLAVVDRDVAITSADAFRIPLAPGGALVLFRGVAGAAPPLAAALQRAVLAELTLPLERNRLVALVQHVEERARARGRDRIPTPPEHRAL